ncbi:MAG: hypothetical protein IKG01_14680 [Lachnospiraceae bacterium]|nr:hypothetical protein [Lachnospiraceae bacterium]
MTRAEFNARLKDLTEEAENDERTEESVQNVPNDDLISRKAAIRWVKAECNPYGNPMLDFESGKKVIEHLKQTPSVQPEQKWIPVKFRPMDSEEREYWEEQFGEELADEDAVMFDCSMPEDGQEILVSYRKWISMDKCEIDGGCYGLEGNGDWDGVIAWQPLPEPYKEDMEDEE